MSNQLVQVSERLAPVMKPLMPVFEQLLPPTLPPERLLQTLYVSCANNPSLMNGNVNALIKAATSAAVLALEIDGVSGQGYLVPFKGSAQFIGGYKGFVTLAGRDHRTLEGFVVLEGDTFEFDEVNAQVRHTRKMGNEPNRKVVAAYAVSRWATAGTVLPQLRVLSLDQLIARRNNSAGYRSKKNSSPWTTNFDAMCRKTPMRDLSKDLPVLSLQSASALENQHDLGRGAWLHPDGGVVIERPGGGTYERSPSEAATEQPGASELVGEVIEDANVDPSGFVVAFPNDVLRSRPTIEEYEVLMIKSIDRAGESRAEFKKLNAPAITELMETHPAVASRLLDAFAAHE